MPTIRHAGVNDSLISRLHTNFQLTCKRNQNEPPQKSYAASNVDGGSDCDFDFDCNCDACLPATEADPKSRVPISDSQSQSHSKSQAQSQSQTQPQPLPQPLHQLQLNVFITHGQRFRSAPFAAASCQFRFAFSILWHFLRPGSNSGWACPHGPYSCPHSCPYSCSYL